MAEAHRFDARAKIFVSGIGFDQPLENLWRNKYRRELFEAIARISPTAVTSPNFSLFSDVPRMENFYNMKRIVKLWVEMSECEIPTALHINARTDRDWARWRELLKSHPEIGAISFEFLTGASQRVNWYVDHLKRLSGDAARSLSLIVRGGRGLRPDCLKDFDQVTLVSATPFVKAMQRRALRIDDGRLRDQRWEGPNGSPLDDLLDLNIRVEEKHVDAKLTGTEIRIAPEDSSFKKKTDSQPSQQNSL